VRRLLVAVALAAAALVAQAQALKPWRGGAAPPIELEDLGGAVHRLADYRGKVVLVNFWASWCAPCRVEMPTIESLRRSLEGRPFAVLAVNVGEGARAARGFAEQVPVGFPLLLDRDTRVSKAWGARILPASYLLGPAGEIRYSFLGELDWSGADARAAIEALMPQARP
jgi:peroxiredoxin